MTVTEYRNLQKIEKQRLMQFTKGELVEELMTMYAHNRKLQNTSSNKDCAVTPTASPKSAEADFAQS